VFHKGVIVGTYRIIGRDAAEKMGGFYSATEFDISKIVRRNGNICEMSRACVDKAYRNDGLALSMLWMGLAEYVLRNKIHLLFGLGSFFGIDVADRAQSLSYLYYYHLAPIGLRATVAFEKLDPRVDPRRTRMNILPKIFVDREKAMREMPPLIKGYLQMGGVFGKGVCIIPREHDNDVFVIVQTKNISKAYQKRFAGNPNAFDSLGLKDTALTTIGKILMLPFKGTFLTLTAVAGLFLDDADLQDAEITKDDEE
jgi:putative hemolysin